MLFSIIIPAYNAEKTIGFCLDSVIRQDFPSDEFEVIVVDDCSPDRQNNIINLYTADYTNGGGNQPEVRLLRHDENKRQGGARNTAIMAARGKWILFLDADDYWRSTKVLETFSNQISRYPNAEIFESSTYTSSASRDLSLINPGPFTSVINNPSEYYRSKPHPCIWAATYAKELVTEIPFREHVYYEDTDWKIRAFTMAKKIVTFDFPFYVYFQNPCSTTSAKSVKAYEDAVTANIICRNEWEKSGLVEELKARILSNGKKYYISSILDVRNYRVRESRHLLNYLQRSGYSDIIKADLNSLERVLSFSAIHAPLFTILAIKTLTATKRFLKPR